MEAVIERFDSNDAEIFLQLPHTITRDHIQMLLRPDKLYPSFATLLRFGTTYCMRRTPNSFHFWHRFYELRGVYNYIYKLILNKNGADEKKLIIEISRILRDLFNKILADNTTPENIRKFNQVIARSFGKVAALENVGLRPFTDTNPRCGNCNFICVADPKKRKELYNMLINSGKVYIDKEGREFVKKDDNKGNEITHYPPTENEFFTKEEFSKIDEIRKI